MSGSARRRLEWSIPPQGTILFPVNSCPQSHVFNTLLSSQGAPALSRPYTAERAHLIRNIQTTMTGKATHLMVLLNQIPEKNVPTKRSDMHLWEGDSKERKMGNVV